jgi:hypothetical protein
VNISPSVPYPLRRIASQQHGHPKVSPQLGHAAEERSNTGTLSLAGTVVVPCDIEGGDVTASYLIAASPSTLLRYAN